MLSSSVKNRAIRHCPELLKNQGSESPNFSLSLGDKRNVETGIAARRTKSMLSGRVSSGALEQKARFRIANRTAQPALQLAAQMMHGQLVSINKHTTRTNLFLYSRELFNTCSSYTVEYNLVQNHSEVGLSTFSCSSSAPGGFELVPAGF